MQTSGATVDDQPAPRERKRNPFTKSAGGGRALSAMMLPFFTVWPPRGFGVLTTTGRRTGKTRRKCVRVVRLGDRAYLVMLGPALVEEPAPRPSRPGCGTFVPTRACACESVAERAPASRGSSRRDLRRSWRGGHTARPCTRSTTASATFTRAAGRPAPRSSGCIATGSTPASRSRSTSRRAHEAAALRSSSVALR